MSKSSARDTPHGEGQIYRKAAKLLEDKKVSTLFSCHAIYMACHGGRLPNVFTPENYPEIVAYGDLFRPDDAEEHAGLWFTDDSLDEVEDHRILMLCMMAAITERP